MKPKDQKYTEAVERNFTRVKTYVKQFAGHKGALALVKCAIGIRKDDDKHDARIMEVLDTVEALKDVSQPHAKV